jgi:lipopolysaccharide/colanic/teichoic acid biosynthesis glycosyltransferase
VTAPAGYPGKRALDLLLVLAAAPLWVPLLAAVAAVVRLRLGSPVLFRQERPGLGERPFRLVKFRTMTGARDARGALLPDAERLTPFGRWLRATSLDELPELWNVLRGDMSLVGPRPLLPRYLPRYSARHRERHRVRPGLTGLAQVSGRNALTWPEKFDLDVEYVRRCSLALDAAILARTARGVLRREGIAAPGESTMPEFLGYGATPPAEAAAAPAPSASASASTTRAWSDAPRLDEEGRQRPVA